MAGSARRGVVGAALRSSGPCGDVVQLTNSSVEDPVIGTGSFRILDQSQVPGWSTTATDGEVELWHGNEELVPAEGDQNAELNANEPATLFQDVPTTPGSQLTWRRPIVYRVSWPRLRDGSG
jgi:hypothetical protein